MTKYLDHIAIKTQSGQAGDPIPIGVPFDNVYLTDADGNTINLNQFYKSYIAYMNETSFVHSGPIEPGNHHIGVWIDQSSTNQDDQPIPFYVNLPTEDELDTELNDKPLYELIDTDYQITYQGEENVIKVTGSVEPFEDWAAYPDKDKPAKYAIVLKLTSKDGYILRGKYLDTLNYKDLVFGQTGDGPGTILLVMAVQQDIPAQFTIFKSQKDADAAKNGLTINIDTSGLVFEDFIPELKSVSVADRTHSFAGKNFNDLYGQNFDVQMEDTNINLSGDLYQIGRWSEEQDNVWKYCGVINMIGKDGYVFTNADGVSSPHQYYLEDTPDDVMLIFDAEHKTADWILYRNKTDLDRKQHGKTYHLSAEGCNFLLAPAIVNAEAASQKGSFEGATYDKLMSPDFTAKLDINTNTIKCTGTIYRYDNWGAFGQSLRNKNYIVLNIAVNELGITTKSQTIDGQERSHTFAETQVEDFVIALDKDHKTYEITFYPNKTAKDSNSAGAVYTIDCTQCTFSDEPKPE